MLSRLFRRDRRGEAIASSLYGAIVAQARRPALYAGLGVPDSVAGRFEMVLLHTILVTRRLALAGEAGRAAGQGVFDLFCRDMDHSLREMGVGDLSVPKKMRKVGEAYFGRAAAYEPGLAAGDAAVLAEPIGRTVFTEDSGLGAAGALAAYAVAAADKLKAQDEEAIRAAGPDFPDPELFVAAEAAR
jgi:cytochrome b pre-mRNA-processing protein 3